MNVSRAPTVVIGPNLARDAMSQNYGTFRGEGDHTGTDGSLLGLTILVGGTLSPVGC